VEQGSKTDRPIAGLLADLKSRGLLDSTLVIWGGEFGRTPVCDGNMNGAGGPDGRDHNPYGFSIWMAGGDVKGGKVIGGTDEIGLRTIDDPVQKPGPAPAVWLRFSYACRRSGGSASCGG